MPGSNFHATSMGVLTQDLLACPYARDKNFDLGLRLKKSRGFTGQ
jgi:hypothetical protein